VLILLFSLGDMKFSINCEKVREVAPMVTLEKAPNAPASFAGLFNYRGMIVPVIDLCQLIYGHPCKMKLSTRIILVDYVKEDGSSHVLGLLAEQVTETLRKSEDAILSSGIQMEDSSYLGGIMMEGKSMIQYIDLERLPKIIKSLPVLEDGRERFAENH